MTRTAHGDAVAGQLRPVGAVGQDLRGPLQRDVAFQPDQHVRGLDHPGDPGRSVVVAVHQPDPARRRTGRGTGPWPRRAGACSAAALSVPAGPCGIASSARHEQQVSGSARSARVRAAESSRGARRCRRTALFAGVSGTRSSVPSSDPAVSGLLFPMVTAPGQPRSRCSRQAEPSTRSRSSSRGDRAERVPPVPGRPRRRRPPRPRPRHQRQVPGQRGDHVLDPRLRHQRHQHDHPDHERRGQQPFPLAPSRTGRPAAPAPRSRR